MGDTDVDLSSRTLRLRQLLSWDDEVDWNVVLNRLRTHPHEASEKNPPKNNYPLYYALNHGIRRNPPPPAVVRAFVEACSDGVSKLDSEMLWSPLGLACRYECGVETVGILLDAYPEAAQIYDKFGNGPLHWTDDPDVARLLLGVHPEGVGARNQRGNLPLHWAKTPDLVRLLLDEGVRQGLEGGCGGATAEEEWGVTPLESAWKEVIKRIEAGDDGTSDEFRSGWEVLVLLARAATSSSSGAGGASDDGGVDVTPLSDRATLPTLHAFVEAGCPVEIVSRAIAMDPDAPLVRDHRSRTALAVAASKSEPDLDVAGVLLSEGCSGAEAAGSPDVDGRLPLHLAAESGWEYERGLAVLVNVEPRALATRDVVTRLYPFMLAGAGPRSNVDSAFRLLRENPSLLQEDGRRTSCEKAVH